MMTIAIDREKFIETLNENNIEIILDFDIDVENETMKIMYFDSSEIYNETIFAISNFKEISNRFNELREETIERYNRWNKKVPTQTLIGYFNMRVNNIIRKIESNDIDLVYRRKALEIMIKENDKSFSRYNEYVRYIRMFSRVETIVGKYNDSPNGVFDYVRVTININRCGLSKQEIISIIKNYKRYVVKDGFQHVRKKVGDDMINFMKLGNMVYTSDSRIVINYVLKTESKAVI